MYPAEGILLALVASHSFTVESRVVSGECQVGFPLTTNPIAIGITTHKKINKLLNVQGDTIPHVRDCHEEL